MTEREGVIKFHLEHAWVQLSLDSIELEQGRFAQMLAWRNIMFELKILGQDDTRYEGLGFGNVSIRLPSVDEPHARRFLVSGSQTSGLTEPRLEHFCEVWDWDLARHRVSSRGLIPPSSESTTHAMIYLQMPAVGCVLHGHDPTIWRHAKALGVPCTPPEAEYGTSAMAAAVQELFSGVDSDFGVFVMSGHQDGVVAFGRDADQAGQILVNTLAQARAKDL